MSKALHLFPLVLLALGGAASAAEPQVYRLSPDEIAKATGAPAADPLFDNSLFTDAEVKRDRRPHGEVGAFVGTGGARGVFGTTAVPLGDSGFAQFSFETSRFGDDRRRR